MKNKFPPKWIDVYNNNDEEYKFFVAISRDPKQNWRSVSVLIKETGLTRTKIDQLIEKYHKIGLLFQKPNNEDFWGYWERVPDMLPKERVSLSDKDKSKRINNYNI